SSGSSGGSGSSPSQTLVISNGGTSDLTLSSGALSLGGSNSGQFSFSGLSLPKTIHAGSSASVNIAYSASAIGIQTATLTIHSNDPDHPAFRVNLRGLGTAGVGGNNEP